MDVTDLPAPDHAARAAARARQAELTKPPGSLGRLEELAIWYAGWRPPRPPAQADVLVFAGNHGVCAQGVNAYPPEVTALMVTNFQAGGAAINQLAASAGAALTVVPLDLERPTADFTKAAAMTEPELAAALTAGAAAVPETDVLVLGEMGIGNSTVAAALAAALIGGPAEAWAGPGTGLDAEGVARKARAVAAGLARHPGRAPFEVLRCLGGREQAAIVGALIAARRRRIPVILDGFIATAAAAVLAKAAPGGLDHCVAGHASAEPGHARLLGALELTPILSLGMRLGEGSGAAVALPVLRAALAAHAGMATFAEAGIG